MKAKKILCYDIKWHKDAATVELPSERVIEVREGDDPAEILTSDFGWLVDSYNTVDISCPEKFGIDI